MRHEFVMKSGAQSQIVRVFIRAATVATDEPTGLGSTGQLFSDLDSAGYIREGASAAVAITAATAAVGYVYVGRFYSGGCHEHAGMVRVWGAGCGACEWG